MSFKKRFPVILLTLFLPFHAFSDTPGDWEFWSKQKASAMLGEKTEFSIAQQFNMRHLKRLYYTHSEALLSYEFTSWFFVDAAFRQAFKSTNNRWIRESRPYTNLILEHEPAKNWTLTFRHRTALRHFMKANHYIWFREKLGICYEKDFEKYTLSPFTSGDLFYNTNTHKVEKYQQYIGLGVTFRNNLEIEFMYIPNLLNRQPEWEWIHAYRIDFSIDL